MTTIFIQSALDGGHTIKLQSDDPVAFKTCIERLKLETSSTNRTYNPTTKTWHVDRYAYHAMQAWLNHCRQHWGAQVQFLNADDDERPEEQQTWTPPPPRRRPTKDDAYRTLYLQPNSPPDLVCVVFRYLATVHHPDKPGGDEEKMKAINAAYKQIAA